MNRRLSVSIGAFCVIAGFALMDASGEAEAGLFRRQGGYSSCGGCYGGCSGRRHGHHHRRRGGGCCGQAYVSSCCGAVNDCGMGGCGAGGCATAGCCETAPYGGGAPMDGGAPGQMQTPPPAPQASPSDVPPPAPSAEAPGAPAPPNAT